MLKTIPLDDDGMHVIKINRVFNESYHDILKSNASKVELNKDTFITCADNIWTTTITNV